MGENKPKRRNHVIIVTSDAVDANVRQFKIRTWVLGLIVIVLFAAFGALLGYLIYEENIWAAAINKSNQQLHAMEVLAKENEKVKADMEAKELSLTQQIEALENEVQVLSTNLNEKLENEKRMTQQYDKLSIPEGFPINGSASAIEKQGVDRPVAKITTNAGSIVIATAMGIVTDVTDDIIYGHNVWVDHGNGYVTIYRNKSNPVVKQGDEVFRGTPIFLINEDGMEVGYQIIQDGEYVNPLDTVDIKG